MAVLGEKTRERLSQEIIKSLRKVADFLSLERIIIISFLSSFALIAILYFNVTPNFNLFSAILLLLSVWSLMLSSGLKIFIKFVKDYSHRKLELIKYGKNVIISIGTGLMVAVILEARSKSKLNITDPNYWINAAFITAPIILMIGVFFSIAGRGYMILCEMEKEYTEKTTYN